MSETHELTHFGNCGVAVDKGCECPARVVKPLIGKGSSRVTEPLGDTVALLAWNCSERRRVDGDWFGAGAPAPAGLAPLLDAIPGLLRCRPSRGAGLGVIAVVVAIGGIGALARNATPSRLALGQLAALERWGSATGPATAATFG